MKSEDWNVADVGTGTGIWLCTLANDAPSSARLDGFDISDDQFPHPSSLPKNVTMHKLDATTTPPEALCGTYDVVHVRLLMSIINDDDPSPVLNHCLKLLSTIAVLIGFRTLLT